MTSKKIDFSKINYINLHAHSEYSLQDGVGTPREHYLETIRKGHCGCAITDHGSYAAPFELYLTKKGAKKDKEIQELLKEKEKTDHPIVAGSELYIYDDRLKNRLMEYIDKLKTTQDKEEIVGIINNIEFLITSNSGNSKYSSLFSKDDDKYVEDIMSNTKSKTNKVGEIALNECKKALSADKINLEALVEKLEEFANKTTSCGSYKYNHITIMAKNEIGHKHLCRLTSEAHLPKNYYMKPRVSLSRLLELKEGLIVTSGCFLGMIPQAIFRGTGEEEDLIKLFIEEFRDDFYLEVHLADVSWKWNSQTRDWDRESENFQRKVNLRLLDLIEKYDLWSQSYITQDSHMPTKEDKEHQDLMILSDSNNKNGWHFHDAYYIMAIEEMYDKCKEFLPEIDDQKFELLCNNSITVLEKCKNFKIDQSTKLVKFNPDEHIVNKDKELSKDLDSKLLDIEKKYSEEYLTAKVLKECKKDYKIKTAVKVSLNYNRVNFENKIERSRYFDELNTLQLNGYNPLYDYFAMVEDLASEVDRVEEVKGLGRGSAAGSLAVYSWNITDIHSVNKKLSFVRFLPKERIGLLYFDFKSYTLQEYLNKFFPNGLTNDVLKEQDNFEEWFKTVDKTDLAPDEIKQIERERFYIYHNPEIWAYYQVLIQSGFQTNNECNSLIAWKFGLTSKPTGPIKEDVGSMPDIDFDTSCRDHLVEYLKKKHGQNRLVLIGTYGTLKVKSAVKEILKIKSNLENYQIDAITKLFDKVKYSEEEKSKGEIFLFDETFKRNIELEVLFKEGFYNSDNKFIDGESMKSSIKKVLGTKKSWGIHAAGVVADENDIIDQLPCFYDPDSGCYVTQLHKDLVEKFGFIKLDLLGLSTLEEIRDTFKKLKKNGIDYFKKLEWIFDTNDQKVMNDIFGKSKTLGIFQFNTPAPTNHLKQIKKDPVQTDCPLHTSALRPGPMSESVDKLLIKTMNGEIEVEKIHPIVDEILAKTYGFIIYQEQVMLIIQQVGGISAYDSDVIRRAMGKKKFDLIKPFEEKFVKHASEVIGIDKDIAQRLWDKMAKFAEYGFNESHAVAYAALSYICAYLKYYHNKEWVASVMSRLSRNNTDKDKETFKKFYKEYRHMIFPPDVNNSKEDYEVVNDKIVTPLFSIARINEDRCKGIVALQPFSSFRDLVERGKAAGVINKTIIEALVLSGACDTFRPTTISLKEKLFNDEINDGDIDFIRNLIGEDKDLDEVFDKLDLGLPLEEEEINQIVNHKKFKSGISKYDFRKMLLKDYYLNIPYLDKDGQLPIQDLKKMQKKMESKKYKEAEESFNVHGKMSSGLLILKELELLKVTSYNYETILSDVIQYHKERDLKYKKVLSVSDAVNMIRGTTNSISKLTEKIVQYKNEILKNDNPEDYRKFVGEIIKLRSTVGEFETRDFVRDLLLGILIADELKFNRIILMLYFNGGFDFFKGLNNNINLKLKSRIDNQTLRIYKTLFNKHDLNLDIVNTDLKIETKLFEYSKFIALLYIISYGSRVMGPIEKIIGDTREISDIKKCVFNLKINKDNVEDFRYKITAFKIAIPEAEIYNYISPIIEDEDFSDLDQEYYIYGATFRPDKKERFKTEKSNYGKTSYNLGFTIANDLEEVEVRIFKSESYSKINGLTLEENIQNFHPVILKGKFKYNPERDQIQFIVSQGNNVVLPLIRQIS